MAASATDAKDFNGSEEMEDTDFIDFLLEWETSAEASAIHSSSSSSSGNNKKNNSDDKKPPLKKPRIDAGIAKVGSEKSQESSEIEESSIIYDSSESSASMAAAIMRKEATLATTALGPNEIILNSPADMKLARLPDLLFSALNSGDIDGIRRIITTHFVDECLLRTVVMNQPVHGRQHIFAMFEGISLTHPDCVCVPKCCRVVRETNDAGEHGARCVLFKFFMTGTNAFPGEVTEYYSSGKLSKYVDADGIGDSKRVAALRAVANKIDSSKSSYVSFGRGMGRWVLNDDDQVVAMHLNWRLTSLRQIDLK